MTEYELAVRIAGKVDKTFNTSLKNTDNKLKKFSNQWDKAITKLDSGYDKIMNVGTKAFKTVTVAATAAATAAVTVGVAVSKAGIEFESAFAGVKKTVDATAEEFATLRQDILDMSTEIPSTAVDIAGVMEVAGQLGIATDNLTDFTEVMVNLGVSTNMTAEEAATALAKFANITGMDPAYYENLGSVIVDLGNNFATTEADIVEMSTRLAATGELAGLSESQIMALATAMSSVGIEAESGGSTMSKLIKKMQVAVETESDILSDYASVANMTMEEFSEAFEKDAVVALSAFIDGLNDTERNGASAIVMLDEMGLTEIRLSNTILALANSGDVMSEAIQTANDAWEENNALAEEAGRRYETTESKIQLLKNAVDVLFIEAFDEMEGPLKEGIEWLTNGVKELTEYATGPNGLGKWAHEFVSELPTMAKNAKKFGEEVLDFVEPLWAAGKWMVKNPEFLADVFIGVGTALATYKIVSGIGSIVSGIAMLASNPVMLGIVGVTAAIGGIAVAVHKSKKNFEELVDLKLEESFGDIVLSLEDIQNVADYLVEDGSLAALKEALSEFDELEEFQRIITDAAAELKKANWKVSIGMELTKEEQEEYQQSIDDFVKGCNDYVVQQNYAVGLAFNVLSDENMTDSEIGSKINQFYAEQATEMGKLGTELADAVNKAFADEILSPQEITEIADIQAKMAEIQNKLADADFEANLISIGKEYDFTKLDSDSFQELQKELTSRLEEVTAQYAEARDQLLANAVLMNNEGKFASEEEFNSYVDQIWADYLGKVSEKQTEIASFLMSGIDNGMVTDMLSSAIEDAKEVLPGYMKDDMRAYWYQSPGIMWNNIYNDIPIDDIETTAAAVDKLLGNMEGIIELIEQSKGYYTDNNLLVPEHITKLFEEYNRLKLMSDPYSVIDVAAGAVIGNNEDYSALLEDAKKHAKEFGYASGYEIPEGVVSGMEANNGIVEEAFDKLAENAAKRVKFILERNPYLPEITLPQGNGPISKLPGHADGGIFTRPHIAAFAEKGPEAAIPLDGSRNAINLWRNVGRLLGMKSVLDDVDLSGGGSGAHIEYKPQLVFNGGTPTQSDIQSALKISQDEFEGMMRQWLKNNARTAF